MATKTGKNYGHGIQNRPKVREVCVPEIEYEQERPEYSIYDIPHIKRLGPAPNMLFVENIPHPVHAISGVATVSHTDTYPPQRLGLYHGAGCHLILAHSPDNYVVMTHAHAGHRTGQCNRPQLELQQNQQDLLCKLQETQG